MAGQVELQNSDPVVAAMERVLKTERDGIDALHRSEDQARDLLAQARAQAAAIARRADGCISKLHTGYLRKIQQDIQTLVASHAARSEMEDAAYDRAVLAEAARRVAAKLTGGP
jgi:hypothetical protein